MSLLDPINEQLKVAMKGADPIKVSALRLLKAEITNASYRKKKSALEDGEILEVIQRLLKQHQESIDAFTKGGRSDLAQKESQEAAILKSFLPPAMEESELRTLIQETIKALGVKGPSSLGAVMKVVLPKVKGRAGGKLVNQLVSEELGKVS